ncbi:hypothetical protein CPB84DRAFT_1812732 [Gymnopilus junonius]|uniref:ZZ-type domain-containing protein n=1 Tax=Gymnopilus junonius TaxID=109634 RepID=A0A9P5TS61_GYMJU|nr:hypothetical protein CPB84DRAFT_1812732 [Gymnopilus junonius]
MVIPDDDVARVMYYLNCVTVGVGLNILVDDLVDFQNYRRLAPHRVALVFKYALEFSPDVFLDKLIFLDDQGEVVTGASRNKFVTVSTACDIVHVQRNIAIAGQVKDVTTVMFFKSSWLEHFYTFPITRQVLESHHCAHCDGKSGVCSCNNGCNTMPESQCQPLLNMLVDVLSNTSISSPQTRPPAMNPETTPVKNANSHACNCDGCGWQFIDGARFKCEVCEDFDLCRDCYNAKRHSLAHKFMQIDRPGSTAIHLPPRNTQLNRTPAPPPPSANPPSYVSAISHTASSPAFYNSMKVSELKEYLRDNGETLCRRAWKHTNISTVDCRDIASRRDKAKQAFQSTQHAAPEPSDRKVDAPSQLQVNDIVVLTGLSRAEMNGKRATVLQAECGGGRAEVHVEELGRTFKVKIENLVLFVDETGDGHDSEDFLD